MPRKEKEEERKILIPISFVFAQALHLAPTQGAFQNFFVQGLHIASNQYCYFANSFWGYTMIQS